MATDIFTGIETADQFQRRALSVVINRFRRDMKAALPRHLFDRQQPIHGTTGFYWSSGLVAEGAFAIQRDPSLRVWPNYISRQASVYAALRTRVRSVASREWSIKPWDADNEADKALAEAVQKSIESIGSAVGLPFRNTIDEIREQALWQMIFYGSAFVAVDWNERLSAIRELDITPRTAMTYYRSRGRNESEEGWRWYDQGGGASTQPVLPGQMIVVVNDGSRANPWGVGVVDALYWLSFYEGVVMPMWGKWLERHASPWVVAKGGDPTTLTALTSVLDAAFDNPNLVLPAEAEVSFVQPGTAAHSVYQGFLDWANSMRREVILGTSLTTAAPQPHGSYALANVHQDSTEEILQGDAKALDNALTWSLCSWLAQINAPQFRGATRLQDGRTAPPYFDTNLERQKDINVVAATLQTANQYVPLPTALIYELLPDIRPPKDGEETIPVAAPPGGGQGAPPGSGDQGLAALLGGGVEGGEAPAQAFAEPGLKAAARDEFKTVQRLLGAAQTRTRAAKKKSLRTSAQVSSATGAAR